MTGYADYICGFYETLIPQPISKYSWPPSPVNKVFNLAMTERERFNYGTGNDELIRLLYTGKLDEALKRNAKPIVQLKDLFKLDQAQRKVVLIEGAPGAGKSTLAWHICRQWKTESKFFKDFKLVVFVQLRDPAIQSAKSLADLFPAQDSESHMEKVISEIKQTKGRGVLFVLDGWDELPASSKSGSFLQELIHNPASLSLHGSTLIITSRPIASGDLYEIASSRVEILGFKQTEVTEYFKESLSNDLDKIRKLEESIQNRPIIEASCYIPLNAAIVVHLFLSLDNSLPNTLHGVFLRLVIHCIVRHIMRQQDDDSEPPRISSLDDLLPDMQTQLSHICAMAYHGVMKNKVTFSEDDLKSFDVPPDICTLSLIQGVESFMPYRSLSYNFLHLSVQELLTAYHISKLPPDEQVKIFNELFGKPRFAAVFQYYAAFTKLQTKEVQVIVSKIIETKDKILLLTLLHGLYEAQDTSMCQHVASELNGELDLSGSAKSLSPVDCIAVGYFLNQCRTIFPMKVNLSRCIFDSYKIDLLGKELKREIEGDTFELSVDLSFCNINGNLTQKIATALFASHVSKLDLSDNPIQDGEDGLSHLCQALTTNTSLVELNLSNCSLAITKENGQALIKMLQSNRTLRSFNLLPISRMNGCGLHYFLSYVNSSLYKSRVLNLGDYPIQVGEDGLSHLCQALTTNTSIVELTLLGFTLRVRGRMAGEMSAAIKCFTLRNVNGHNLRYISDYIKLTSAITRLDLSNSLIQKGKDGFLLLCEALTENTSIEEVNLSQCMLQITEKNGKALSRMLKTNKTLKSLEISPLVNTNGCGVRYLSEGISSSSAISKLDLSHNPIQDGEDGLSHLCQALTTNTSLVELNLSDCKLTINGKNGQALSRICMLETNKTLLTLKLLPISWTDGKGMLHLACYIRSKFLHWYTELDFSSCPIQDGEDGLVHLYSAVVLNNFITKLDLRNCQLHRTDETRKTLSNFRSAHCGLPELDPDTKAWLGNFGEHYIFRAEFVVRLPSVSD